MSRPIGTAPRAGRIVLAARRIVRHPTWAAEYARAFARRRRPAEPLPPARAQPLLTTEGDALARVLKIDEAEARRRLAAFEPPPRAEDDPGARNDASIELQRVLDVIVRTLQPRRMVETGVARGYSSAVALRAMDDCGVGQLHSIELPSIDPRQHPDADIGRAVPPDLRRRWSLRLGPSRRLLPRLLAELGSIDLFLHDSDHSAEVQRLELECVWPHLRPGGVAIVDDVESSALLDFGEQRGAPPLLIERWPPEASPLGVVRAP